ncbi:HNH endonuclease signature motif containing protein [Pantoea sp. RRHST58]|uniref:HNH endonuclease signature motif containing protein n=1 Tax=Pantoea sp. RRHST58 TaxID=3425183 RepID=UPI003D9FF2C2
MRDKKKAPHKRGFFLAQCHRGCRFSTNSRPRMKEGLAPCVHTKERVGGHRSFELYPVELILQGGEVYDIDNLRALTPKRHIEIHSKQ